MSRIITRVSTDTGGDETINNITELDTTITESNSSSEGAGVSSYNDLTDKPVLFDGDYDSLTDQPDLKTINGESILGSGDLVVLTGATVVDAEPTQGSTNVAQSGGVYDYISNESNNLFYKSNLYLFPNADLPVRRYTSDIGITDYSIGYSQTSISEGLQIQIPSSGSASIAFYLNTGLQLDGNKLTSEHIINAISSGTVGVGYIADNGDYISYCYSSSGNFERVNKKTKVTLNSGLGALQTGDVVRFELTKLNLVIFINDIQRHSAVVDDFVNDLLITKNGFIDETVNLRLTSDAIRNYVNEEINNIDANPNCFYDFNPIGSSTGDGIFKVYQKINGTFYGGFKVENEIDLSELVYKNVWRITSCDLYEFNGVDMIDTTKDLLTSGESECVYKRNANKDDFTGGVQVMN